MYGGSWDKGRFMKDFRFDTICNITREPQEVQRYNKCLRVVCCDKVLKVVIINGKVSF